MTSGICKPTSDTVTVAMSNFLQQWQDGGNITTNFDMQKEFEVVSLWAAEVSPNGKSDGVFESLRSFSENILNTLTPGKSPLETCADYIFQSWLVNKRQKSPVDDRQYYSVLNGWLISNIISFQVQATQVG